MNPDLQRDAALVTDGRGPYLSRRDAVEIGWARGEYGSHETDGDVSLVSKDSGSAGRAVNRAGTQVIIVDDNEDAAMSLTMLLELEGISAAAAPDAETALQLAGQITPPLLLIDIGLPGMNGFELAKRLREAPNTRRSTLIALTGSEATAAAGDAGAAFDQYWTKPFDPKKLLAEVRAVLGLAPSAG